MFLAPYQPYFPSDVLNEPSGIFSSLNLRQPFSVATRKSSPPMSSTTSSVKLASDGGKITLAIEAAANAIMKYAIIIPAKISAIFLSFSIILY